MANGIFKLQNEYLNGSEQALTDLYKELVQLAKTIIVKEELKLDTDAAFDMATSVVMRLSSLRVPIITASPSAFVKRALFYYAHNIQKNHNGQCLPYPENFPVTDTYFKEENCDDLIFEVLANIDVPEDLMYAVSYCLFTQQPIKAVRVRIRDREDKRRFTKVMEEIHEYINQKTVCLSMLQWDSNTRPQILRKASIQRTRVKRESIARQVDTSKPTPTQPLLFNEMESITLKPIKTQSVLCKVRKRSDRSTPCNPTPWLPGFIL